MIELFISRPCHNTDVKVVTNSHTLSEQIRQYYAPFVMQEPARETADIEVYEEDGHAQVRVQGQTQRSSNPLQTVINYTYETISIKKEYYAMHAAAVESGGYACALAGATMSGKTTLTTYLVSRGFGYLTDDCVLIDRESLCVVPYPCDIHLRQGGMDVLEEQGIAVHAGRFSHPTAERYIYTPPNRLTHPVPLRSLLWLERTENCNEVREIPPIDLFTLLMKSAISHAPASVDHLRFLTTLMKLPCKKLLYKDMPFAEGIIRGYLDGGASSGG